MKHVQRTLGSSERFSCSTVQQARSTQRYEPQKRSQEEALVKRMLELSGKHPRFGNSIKVINDLVPTSGTPHIEILVRSSELRRD